MLKLYFSRQSWNRYKQQVSDLIHNILNTPRLEQANPLRSWLILLVMVFIFLLIFGFVWVSYSYQINQANVFLQEKTQKIAAHIQKQLLQDIQTAQLLPYLPNISKLIAINNINTNQLNKLDLLKKKVLNNADNLNNLTALFKQGLNQDSYKIYQMIDTLQANRPDLLRVQYWYTHHWPMQPGCQLPVQALQIIQSLCYLVLNTDSKAAPNQFINSSLVALPEVSEHALALLSPNQPQQFSLPYKINPDNVNKINKSNVQISHESDYAIDLWVMQTQESGYRYIRFTYSLERILSNMPQLIDLDTDTAFLLPNDQVLVKNTLFHRNIQGQSALALLALPGVSLQFKLIDFKVPISFFANFLSNTVFYLSALLIFSVLLLCIDVRKRLHVQYMLQNQYALQTAMEKSLLTGLRARDLSGTTLYVNPALCNMLGYSIQELVGGSVPMPYWPPEKIPEYQTLQEKILAGNCIHSEGMEAIFMHKDGRRFPVLIFEAPLFDAKGVQTGWMSSIVDTTYQKEMERITQQQQEQLAQQSRLAIMGELSSTVSHELNQPLAAISSYATATLNMLQSGIAQSNEIEEGLKRITKQAQRAGSVIKSIHNFVRRNHSIQEAVDLRAVLTGIYPLIELQAKHLNTHIVIHSAQLTPKVWADRLMIEQVILNLTRNAMEAMQHLPVNDRCVFITIQTHTSNAEDRVRFGVSDCGDGIDNAIGSQVFNPFFSTKNDGMGMGLAICRTVIESAHGRLWYENLEKGCQFIFELPVYPIGG